MTPPPGEGDDIRQQVEQCVVARERGGAAVPPAVGPAHHLLDAVALTPAVMRQRIVDCQSIH